MQGKLFHTHTFTLTRSTMSTRFEQCLNGFKLRISRTARTQKGDALGFALETGTLIDPKYCTSKKVVMAMMCRVAVNACDMSPEKAKVSILKALKQASDHLLLDKMFMLDMIRTFAPIYPPIILIIAKMHESKCFAIKRNVKFTYTLAIMHALIQNPEHAQNIYCQLPDHYQECRVIIGALFAAVPGLKQSNTKLYTELCARLCALTEQELNERLEALPESCSQ